jgi:aminoglycoside 6-adenylyltransferase
MNQKIVVPSKSFSSHYVNDNLYASKYGGLVKKVIGWAQSKPDIHIALVVGSRARTNHPADEWADLDIMIFTKKPQMYLSQSDWMQSIGEVWTKTRNITAGNEAEWLVTFAGGLDVDFVFSAYPKTQWKLMLWLMGLFPKLKRFIPKKATHQLERGAEILGRGVIVLVDKDNLASRFQQFIVDFKTAKEPPTLSDFLEVVERFWCLAEKTAKKICRGELYVAVNWIYYLHMTSVLPMIEWHAHMVSKGDRDSWHEGRFFEEWAGDWVLGQMVLVFPHYNKEDVINSLYHSMDLFSQLTVEVSKYFGCPHPKIDAKVSTYIKTMIDSSGIT